MKNDAKSEKLMHLLCFFRMRGNKNPTVETTAGELLALIWIISYLKETFLPFTM